MAAITGFPIKECRINFLGTDIRIIFIQGLFTENTALIPEKLMLLLLPWEPGTMTFPRGTEVILEPSAEFSTSQLVIISNEAGAESIDYYGRGIPLGEGTTVWLGASAELWVRLQTRNTAWVEIYAQTESYGLDYLWEFKLSV